MEASETQVLLALLGLAGAVIVALIGLCGTLLQRNRKNTKSNPGPDASAAMMAGYQAKLEGIAETLARMEAAQTEGNKLLVEVVTILRQK